MATTMLPGKYRVNFLTDPPGQFYIDIEVKAGKPRAFVRGVGPAVQNGVVSPFVGRTLITEMLIETKQAVFWGKFPPIVHQVDSINRL